MDPGVDGLVALGVLAEPQRARIYAHLASAEQPRTRQEVCEALGIGRTLVGFHLDKLQRTGFVRTAGGDALHPKRQQRIPGGEWVVLNLPGGGGHQDPFEREPALVVRDVEDGLVSVERARDAYGVILTESERPGTYAVDSEATVRRRKEATPDTDA